MKYNDLVNQKYYAPAEGPYAETQCRMALPVRNHSNKNSAAVKDSPFRPA